MLNPAELQPSVRAAIYERIVATGQAPTISDIAAARGLDANAVAVAVRMLHDAHTIVLQPGTVELWSAPPFSAVPTPFRVRAESGSWYAPCAWDLFGIPAALKRDAVVETRCAWSGDRLTGTIRDGVAHAAGVVHLEVPARHFWDDIVYT
jgi:hypothetical protein